MEVIYINVEEKHAKTFTCYVCMEKFTLKETLTEHIKVHTKPTKKPHFTDSKCTVCDKVFSLEDALEVHMKQEHLKEFNYFCETCQLGFVILSDYKFHRETEHEPPKPCRVCHKLFPSSRQLKQHKLEHHRSTKASRTMKPCPLCNESVGNLKRHHEHCHTDTKQYTCEICGKSFKQKPTLKLHLMVHQDDRRHMCEYCGHVFLTNNHLVVHTRTHTGDKPYQCEVCQDRFGTRGSLVNHFRIHSGEKPFVCEHCGDSFARKKYLMSHYKCIHS